MNNLKETPSRNSIFIWNILGSLSSSALSLISLMLVARMLIDSEADIFSIAWSISQMLATIASFQIRNYQATDVKERFCFSQYVIFRILCIGVMIISSVFYVITNGFNFYKSLIVVLMCLFRAVEAFADVFEGYFQQKNRLDLVGKAVTYRIAITLVLFFVILINGRNLLVATLALLLGFLFSFFFFDLRYAKFVFNTKMEWGFCKHFNWIFELIKEGTPIFVNAFLMMSIMNAPKMAIDSAISTGVMSSGIQTIFNILIMPASMLTLVYVVFRPLLTKMAVQWNSGEKYFFLKTMIVIMLILFPVSLFLIGFCYFFGTQCLSFLYGINLNAYTSELIVLLIGGCACTFSYVFDNALLVMRRQYLLLIAYLISWIITKLTVGYFVVRYGLFGAAITYLISMSSFLIVTIVIFGICFKKMKKANS